MMSLSGRALVWPAVVVGFLVAIGPSACGQATANANTPKLDQPFTFTLQAERDHVMGDFISSLRQEDQLRRHDELETINQPVLSKALDLLRYSPISLGGSDGDEDDFSLPSYLQPGYVRVPPDAHLFDAR